MLLKGPIGQAPISRFLVQKREARGLANPDPYPTMKTNLSAAKAIYVLLLLETSRGSTFF